MWFENFYGSLLFCFVVVFFFGGGGGRGQETGGVTQETTLQSGTNSRFKFTFHQTCFELYSNECRKTKAKAITLANHKGNRQVQDFTSDWLRKCYKF